MTLCVVDWSAVGDVLAGIGALAGAGAVVFAAKVGKQAVIDYREQKIADNEIAATDDAMTAAYRAEEAVQGMRGRVMLAGELHASEEQLKELGFELDGLNEKEKQAQFTRAVIYRRAEFFKSEFDAVFSAIPRARAYFSDEVVQALREFPRCRNEILSAVDILPMLLEPTTEDSRQTLRSIRSVIFGIDVDGKNEIDERLKSAIGVLERELKSKLLPKQRND